MEGYEGNKTMTIDEMKMHEWVVCWSGGKDSTATIILMHEAGVPIKEILYAQMMYDENTPATIPIMAHFVEHAKNVFESWGYKVRIVKSLITAKEITEYTYRKSRFQMKNGSKYGITAFSRKGCKFAGIKMQTIKNCTQSIKEDYQMIGYAFDETDRTHRLGGKKQSIMVSLGIKEEDAFVVCRKYNLLSPLYDLKIPRDGCWFCPNATKKEMELVKTAYPELYRKIQGMIDMCSFNVIKNFKILNIWAEEYQKENHLKPTQ